jgi:steroid delta-isomerase-like uncharacterized protein
MDTHQDNRVARFVGARTSRRAAVGRVGGGGLVGVLAGLGGFGLARAQEASPTAVTAGGALPPTVARFVAAMKSANADQLAASYAPGGVLEEVGFAATYTGRDAIRKDEATFLAAFPDAVIQVSNAFASGDWGAVEWSFTGTYVGALPGLPGGAGQTVSFRGASILHVGDAGILRHTQYVDDYSILVQLGALPAPAAGGGATPEASPAA